MAPRPQTPVVAKPLPAPTVLNVETTWLFYFASFFRLVDAGQNELPSIIPWTTAQTEVRQRFSRALDTHGRPWQELQQRVTPRPKVRSSNGSSSPRTHAGAWRRNSKARSRQQQRAAAAGAHSHALAAAPHQGTRGRPTRHTHTGGAGPHAAKEHHAGSSSCTATGRARRGLTHTPTPAAALPPLHGPHKGALAGQVRTPHPVRP